MPIKPPNLDDRRYADIIAETQKLIPQYCPQWTNFSPADPGMTLVQLFAWMTELIIYRLNKVPDKTYIHFLNFIGEERKRAQPSIAPLTFHSRVDRPTELPAFSPCATRQTESKQALTFLTCDALTVHSSLIDQLIVVRGGINPLVREVPFAPIPENPAALSFAKGKGIQLFDIDPLEFGPDAFTPFQYFFVAHDDFRLMTHDTEEIGENGRIRIRRKDPKGETVGLSIVDLFDWEFPSQAGWLPINLVDDEVEQLGMLENALDASLPDITEYRLNVGNVFNQLPEEVQQAKWWIRGRLDYERWLTVQMRNDMHIYWKDDRGGSEREIFEWKVRSSGRNLEFELQDLPPLKAGWTLRFSLIDRGMSAGKSSYLPRYRWYYRRGESWEEIPMERVRMERTTIVITGPLTDMAVEGVNIRAERIEVVNLQTLCQDLDLDVSWVRPVQVFTASGENVNDMTLLEPTDRPWEPYQYNASIPPSIGRKFYIGSDILLNRREKKVKIEIDYSFQLNGEDIEEPTDLYALQFSYRAEDSWRVVRSKDKRFSKCTLNQLPSKKAKVKAGLSTITLELSPPKDLPGLATQEIQQIETAWLRLELITSNLSGEDQNKEPHPISLRFHDVRLKMVDVENEATYEEPMRSPRIAQVDFRMFNQRLTRVQTKSNNRMREFFPFYSFIEIEEANESIYLHFDKPLPVGSRHSIHFRCRGEAYLPEDIKMEWEILETAGPGRYQWRRLQAESVSESSEILPAYSLQRTGSLEFPLSEEAELTPDGFWLRGRYLFSEDPNTRLPALPPVTHIMLNTVNAVNLHTVRTERYSGQGVPDQRVQLFKKPIFLHEAADGRTLFSRPEAFDDLKVYVEEDGERNLWTRVSEAELLIAGKDAEVYTVEPVDGILVFGNGIRGRMLPVGSNNILVETYRVVPGAKGNVAPFELEVCDVSGVLEVSNLLPAAGGRDAESVDDIIRRAPSLLTTRDRAVTSSDFEAIALEASSEVARAACNGRMDEDGQIEVVILPNPTEADPIPDPFLSVGLRDHVSSYLKRRCLVNVQPVVRLAQFMPIDISITVRLRPNANFIQVREHAESWILNFLNPYIGGLDQEGWPFGGTLYAQDFARMVSEIPEVRHVVNVQLYDMANRDVRDPSGWEEGLGESEIILENHDLFSLRRVRVVIEDARR